MRQELNSILVLAPHTDDGEFGCGGTIVKFIEKGSNVYYVAFSTAKRSLPNHLPKDTLEKEVRKAVDVLGIKKENLILFDYDVRTFPQFRQEILEDMIKLKFAIKPDIVFLPSTFDTHQDHNVVSQEGFRAFKNTSMLGYEIPWNNLKFTNNCFSFLKKRHISKKVDALKEYKSQLSRNYASEEFVRSLAKTRGVQAGKEFAEAFEVIRWLI